MLPLMKEFGFVDQAYDFKECDEEEFTEQAALLSRQIARCKRILAPMGMHVLSRAPDPGGIATMLSTILIKPAEGRPSLEEIAGLGR